MRFSILTPNGLYALQRTYWLAPDYHVGCLKSLEVGLTSNQGSESLLPQLKIILAYLRKCFSSRGSIVLFVVSLSSGNTAGKLEIVVGIGQIFFTKKGYYA